MSYLKSLQMPERCRSVALRTARGEFAILEAQPTRGVCDRRPALLVPGYTGSKENFLPILEPLASAGRTVVAVDMRGQYQSPHASDRVGYAPDALASDIHAIADAVGDGGGVHLVGHSLGGLIAREAVLQGTSGLLSLTLLGSGPGRIDGPRAAELGDLLSLAGADAEDRPRSKERLAAKIGHVWQERHEPQARADGADEHVIAFMRERALRTCPVSLIELAQYLLGCPDRTDELAAVVASGLPVQVVYGENDDAWPADVQELMAKRLDAGRVCIPGATHSPAIDAPVTTASTLTEFWNAAERALPTIHHCGRDRSAAAEAV